MFEDDGVFTPCYSDMEDTERINVQQALRHSVTKLLKIDLKTISKWYLFSFTTPLLGNSTKR